MYTVEPYNIIQAQIIDNKTKYVVQYQADL